MNWSGFHLGVNLGLDWLSGQQTSSQSLTSTVTSATLSNSTSPTGGSGVGVLFGGQIGYDAQLSSVLLGLETDMQGSSVSDRAAGTAAVGSQRSFIQNQRALNWLGTTRLRLGYVADNFVPYATGGLAYGGVQMSTSANTSLINGSIAQTASRSATLVGFAVGGGVDYAFDRAWALRLEALYYDLGSLSLTAPGTSNPTGVTGMLNTTSRFNGGLVRFGINLHL